MKIVVVGEILWDVFDDAERLGGAPFNFAVHSGRLGHDVRFVSAVGDDARGERAREAVRRYGLDPCFVITVPGQNTGAVRVSLDVDGRPSYTIERPAAYDFADPGADGLAALSSWSPDWVCYGTLQQLYPQSRELTRRILKACSGARRFYDVNLRKDSYTPELVAALLREANVLKLNEDEVAALAEISGLPAQPVERFAREIARAFGYQAVAVTLGAQGAAVLVGDDYVEAPGFAVRVKDTVGSGDAFAAAFLDGLGRRRPVSLIAEFANRVGALVASHSGAVPEWSVEDALALGR